LSGSFLSIQHNPEEIKIPVGCKTIVSVSLEKGLRFKKRISKNTQNSFKKSNLLKKTPLILTNLTRVQFPFFFIQSFSKGRYLFSRSTIEPVV
jgi:hypothetical protein